MKKKTTTRKRLSVSVPQTMQEMLALLRLFFRTADGNHPQKLWDVLTALRGPDDNQNRMEIKEATTAVIRRSVLRIDQDKVLAMVQGDQLGNIPVRHDIPYGHFKTHARNAFYALGLDWGANNSPKRKKKA